MPPLLQEFLERKGLREMAPPLTLDGEDDAEPGAVRRTPCGSVGGAVQERAPGCQSKLTRGASRAVSSISKNSRARKLKAFATMFDGIDRIFVLYSRTRLL